MQIEGLNTQNFFGGSIASTYDVNYRLDEAGDIFPVTASLGPEHIDGSIKFDFDSNPLLAGETSHWMFVGDPNNDLSTFGNEGAQLLTRDITGSQFSIPFDSYVTFIPIPASLPLLATGLIVLIGIAKRRVN